MPGVIRHVKRTTTLVRDSEILTLHLKGKSQVSIATTLGLNQSSVSRALGKYRKQLREENLETAEEVRKQESLKLDVLEAQYWTSFEASKHEGAPGGDHNYLAGVGRCIQARAKLHGLDVPVLQKAEILQIGSSINESERVAKISGLLDAARARGAGDTTNEDVIDADVIPVH